MFDIKVNLIFRILGCMVFVLSCLSAEKNRLPAEDFDLSSSRQTRIVGGTLADPTEWPFIAVIATAGESNLAAAHFCGGSLIHPRFILTAAHCVEDLEPGDIQVALGVYDLRNSGYETYNVIDIIIHPDWDDSTNDGDIALLVLDRPALGYSPIALVAEGTGLDLPGVLASAAGWGLTTDGGISSNELRAVNLPIVDLTTANLPIGYDGAALPRMIPAGYVEGGRDSCQGDSGGPLVVPDGEGGRVLAGVVSWGEGCALPNFPGLYARVSSFRDWVLAQTRPYYFEWESSNNLIAEYIDSDGDGWKDGAEYMFGTNFADATKFPQTPPIIRELTPGDPLLTIEFPQREASHLNYVAESWDGEGDWVELAEVTYGVAPLGTAAAGFTQVAYRSPETLESSDKQFMRVKVNVSEAYPVSVASIRVGQNRRSALILNDEVNNFRGGSFRKDFLVSVDAPATHRIGLHSNDFDTYLMILSADGSTLQNEDDDGGFEANSSLIIERSSDYLIRVTSSNPDATGRFSLGIVDTTERQIIFPNQSIAGTLSVADSFDPVSLTEGNYYKQDFFLIAPANGSFLQIDLESTEIDSYLTAIDPRTGRVIDFNEDFNDTANSQLEIGYLGSNEVLLRVSTAVEEQVGDFILRVTESE
jgi:hypothetical protein